MSQGLREIVCHVAPWHCRQGCRVEMYPVAYRVRMFTVAGQDLPPTWRQRSRGAWRGAVRIEPVVKSKCQSLGSNRGRVDKVKEITTLRVPGLAGPEICIRT